MEQYVIDTSVLMKGFIQESDSKRVHNLLAMLNALPALQLHIPEACLLECGSVLWKQVRFSGTAIKDIQLALDNLLNLPLNFHPTRKYMSRALQISLDYGLPIYDTIYIALAESLKIALITVDGKQSTVATQVGVNLKPLTDFPEINL